jgi:serine/threonine protein kinase
MLINDRLNLLPFAFYLLPLRREPAMNELLGTLLGQYRIDDVIGRGGAATVYKAYQPSLERNVAIKVLCPTDDPQFAARFQREAWVIAQLQHPNILPIYECGERGGLFYLALQYIDDGATLAQRLGVPTDPGVALALTERVLSALEYAHMRGVVHRDLKPANILMAAPDWPVLADFGIAKLTSASPGLTLTGWVIGTPEYMAPEQASGQPIDARADIYAMGVVLYEMLTGRVPFTSSSPVAVLQQHLNAPPPSLRSAAPHLPAAVEAIVLRALAKAPADRYPSAAAMREDVLRVSESLRACLKSPQQDLSGAAHTRHCDHDYYLAPRLTGHDRGLNLFKQLVKPTVAFQHEAPPRKPRRITATFAAIILAAALLGGGSGLGSAWLQQIEAEPAQVQTVRR